MSNDQQKKSDFLERRKTSKNNKKNLKKMKKNDKKEKNIKRKAKTTEFLYGKYLVVKDRYRKNIRLKILVLLAFCLFVSISSYSFFYRINEVRSTTQVVNYADGVNKIENIANSFFGELENIKDEFKAEYNNLSQEAKESDEIDVNKLLSHMFSEVLRSVEQIGNYPKIEITDVYGKVIYSSVTEKEYNIDIGQVLQKATSQDQSDYYNKTSEYVVFKTIDIGDQIAYFIYTEIPQGEIKNFSDPNEITPFIFSAFIGVVLFFYMSSKKMKYLFSITEGVKMISRGDLDQKIIIQGHDELSTLAESINDMSRNLKKQMEAERAVEKSKNDLITNVSHDLKTPLTSIIGYLSLIKEGKYENEEMLNEYVNIVYDKSEGLKKLIRDLFDYTMLSNTRELIHPSKVDFNQLMYQILDEYTVLFQEANMELVCELDDEEAELLIDSDKIVRVFENLLSNAIKYGDKNSQVIVITDVMDDHVMIEISNETSEVNEKNVENLFERFYKIDKSRTNLVEGSGLGLAISKSIIELHGGQ
ncbi:MAG: HAMP domain-containing sensor histidine kinase, partial [Acidaminobacteraceae bacterium]